MASMSEFRSPIKEGNLSLPTSEYVVYRVKKPTRILKIGSVSRRRTTRKPPGSGPAVEGQPDALGGQLQPSLTVKTRRRVLSRASHLVHRQSENPWSRKPQDHHSNPSRSWRPDIDILPYIFPRAICLPTS